MFIARFALGDIVKYGIVDGNTVLGLKYSPFSSLGSNLETDGTKCNLDNVKLLYPCVPSKIVALGLNYRAHIAESKHEAPAFPRIFFKPPSSLISLDETIELPTTGKTDHEAELAIVMGRTAKRVSEAEAKNYVFGYTCLNDVSERVIQKEDGMPNRAKGFDTFTPMGPWIATGIDGDSLKIEALVNGVVKQSSNTSNLIHGVSALISIITNIMTLYPGDVIATGTPEGVSALKHGDTVDIRIEKIGTLRNYVVNRK